MAPSLRSIPAARRFPDRAGVGCSGLNQWTHCLVATDSADGPVRAGPKSVSVWSQGTKEWSSRPVETQYRAFWA